MQKHRCVKVLPDLKEKRKSNQSVEVEKSTLTAQLFRELMEDFFEEAEVDKKDKKAT